jgi:hypothetical protein
LSTDFYLQNERLPSSAERTVFILSCVSSCWPLREDFLSDGSNSSVNQQEKNSLSKLQREFHTVKTSQACQRHVFYDVTFPRPDVVIVSLLKIEQIVE